jgi:hypothetical protein
MNTFHTSIRRQGLLGVTAALAVPVAALATGAVSFLAAPAMAASAATTTALSPYSFTSRSFGSQVTASQAGLRSAPATSSGIGCTKQTGATSDNTAETDDANAQVHSDRVATSNYTYRTTAGTDGVRSLTTIASSAVGNSSLGLAIKGLDGMSNAYATKGGALNAASRFTFDDVTPTGSQAGSLPTALKNLLNGPTKGVLDKLNAGQSIVIPGLGVLKLGAVDRKVGTGSAESGSTGLEIDLYGTDGVAGGGDDSSALLGSTHARIARSATSGLFGGTANGLRANRSDGTVVVGPQETATLPCEGTAGAHRTTGLAQLNLANLNQLVVGGLQNTVYGEQNTPAGGRTGRTETSIDSLKLGSRLTVTDIVSAAQVVRTATGGITRSVTQKVGSIRAGGKTYTVPKPGETLTIPGVAVIEVPQAKNTTYGVQVTGLRVTLLGGQSPDTVVNLANTKTEIRNG